MSGLRRETTAGISYLHRRGAVGSTALPLVLLHGIGSNAMSFAPLIDALPDEWPVMAWDAPGYGNSAPLAIEWPGATDYAYALTRFLAALGVARFNLAGHSLGTLMAARFAAISPARVENLILMSPTLGYDAPVGGPMPPKVAARIDDLDRLGPEAFAAARAGNLVADPVAHPDVVEAVRREMAAVRRPGYDQAVRMLASGRLLDDLKKLSTPTSILVGAQDRTTPPAVAQEAYAALDPSGPRHTYYEIPGAAHAVCQEDPRAVAQSITDAVAKKAIAHA